jgi:hypothetical protein
LGRPLVGRARCPDVTCGNATEGLWRYSTGTGRCCGGVLATDARCAGKSWFFRRQLMTRVDHRAVTTVRTPSSRHHRCVRLRLTTIDRA